MNVTSESFSFCHGKKYLTTENSVSLGEGRHPNRSWTTNFFLGNIAALIEGKSKSIYEQDSGNKMILERDRYLFSLSTPDLVSAFTVGQRTARILQLKDRGSFESLVN